MKAVILAAALALFATPTLAESPTVNQLLDRTNRATDTMIMALTEQKSSVCPKRTGARVCQSKFDTAKVKIAAIGIEMTVALSYAAVGDKEKAVAGLEKVVTLRAEFDTVVAELNRAYGE